MAKRTFLTRTLGGPAGSGSGSTAPIGASLSIVDQADGTGATATIAGAAGYANKVLVYTLDTFELVGTFTRSGNGDVDLILAAGRYFGVLTCDDFYATAANFLVTDVVASYDETLHDQVLSAVQALGLAGIDLANIKKGKHPVPQIAYAEGVLAGVLVAKVGEQFVRKYNSADDVGYGYLVACWTAVNKLSNTANLESHQKWRQQINRAFNITPTNVPIPHPLVTNITVEPASPVLFSPEALFKFNTDVTAQVIRVFIRQPR
jgi:hypothetical protein